MKADLTRNTFDPFKRYSDVLLQQGRVQLDADWNERGAILLRYIRTLAVDLHGAYWGGGFALSRIATGQPAAPVAKDFLIGAGHYYVDGILCELDATPVAIIAPQTGMNPQQIRVSTLLVDGLLFQKNQYIEIIDNPPAEASIPKPVTVWKITDIDPGNRVLTLDQEIKTFLDTAGFAYPSIRRRVTYTTQADYPVSEKLNTFEQNQTYQVYLDVWERLITYLEDDSIREVALGGPDTATRTKIVWQVKALLLGSPTQPCLSVQEIKNRFQQANRGQLKAWVAQSPASTDPCILSPTAGYRGTENQLYRVEIHRPGNAWDGIQTVTNDMATFKWSRDNGSVAFPIVNGVGTNEIFLENLGRDDRLGLSEGDWVEVLDDDYVLQGNFANLFQVQSIDRGSMKVTLTGTPSTLVGNNPDKHPILRRWDHKEGSRADGGLQLGSDGAALIIEDSNGLWLNVEDGIQIQFQKPDAPLKGAPVNNEYRAGDYWLIPARAATGDVEWPRTKDRLGNTVSIAIPPQGVEHHYAPLGLITVDTNGNVETSPCTPTDPYQLATNLPHLLRTPS